MADTKLTIEEIEVALAESRDFSYLKNLMVFNVYGLLKKFKKLPIF